MKRAFKANNHLISTQPLLRTLSSGELSESVSPSAQLVIVVNNTLFAEKTQLYFLSSMRSCSSF